MKVVILGAGASYDSISEYYEEGISFPDKINSWKPPLGTELFDKRKTFRDILEKHSGAKALSNEARNVNDIEIYLEDIKNAVAKSKDNFLAWQLLSTQLYLKELLLSVSLNYQNIGTSNYGALLTKAYRYCKTQQEEIAFISFNYDLFLETALETTTPYSLKKITDYVKNDIKIFKPHGSCNWIKKFTKILTVNSDNSTTQSILQKEAYKFISNDPKFELSNEIEISNTGFLDFRFRESNSIEHAVPQLAIPLKSKTDYICPLHHINEMTAALSRASELLIIGWKCGEIKFKDLLKTTIGERKVKVTIVDKKWQNIEKELKEISNSFEVKSFKLAWSDKYVVGEEPTFEESTFTSYIRNIAANKFEDFFAVE